MTSDELRNAASAIMAKREEQSKLLMLTCERCRNYHEATYYTQYCPECRQARRAT
jgi:Zn finger protein HypA/HybF involved in hydrogenase expression